MCSGTERQDDMFSHLLGQEHDDDRSLNRQIPAGAPVDIQVPHGDVTVTPSGDDQIHVQAHLVVYAANDRAARRNLDALAPQLMVNGRNVTLRAADGSDGRADLTIEIPNGAVPSVTAGHGDVTLEGLAGAGERERRPGGRQSRQHRRRSSMCAWAKATSAPTPSPAT